MKNSIFKLITPICFVLSISCTGKKESVDSKPVAKVGLITLSVKSFSKKLANNIQNYDAFTIKNEAFVKRIKDTIVSDFIIESITLIWAKQNNVFVTKQDTVDYINSIKKSYPDDLSFRNNVLAQNQTYKDWVRSIRSKILQKKVLDLLYENSFVEITDEELKKIYKTKKDDFKINESALIYQIVTNAKEKALMLKKKIRTLEDFKKYAKKYSITPEGKNGGNLGWVEKGTLDVFDTAIKLRVGKLSSVIQSQYGHHLFRISNKRNARTKKFEEVKSQILYDVKRKREQAIYSKWLESEIKRTKIFKDERLIKSIQIHTKGSV